LCRFIATDEPMSLVAVAIISDLEFGGAQRQVVELANHMDPEQCRMYVVSLSSFVPLADSLRDRDQRLKLVLRRFRFDFTVVPRLIGLLRSVQASVIHSYLFDATIAARLAGRAGGCAAIIGSERNSDYVLKRSDFVALRITQLLSDLTIANSSAGADFNARMLGDSKERYRVVHNGVDVERFNVRRAEEALRSELGIKPHQPVVGMFASFKPQKNHPYWLRAARRVVDRFPDVKLLFVGDELNKGMSDSVEFKQKLNRTVDELRLRGNCLFIGNRKDVERYYNLCTCTVLPSLFEGTPNAALESMASGVPVVATRVADNAYIIPDGKAGYLVGLTDEEALAERVGRLLKDGTLRESLGRSARQWAVDEFSGRRLAEKTLAVYREAVARS
jgi:glycosyltransferase involved in cell wall biosynthesis